MTRSRWIIFALVCLITLGGLVILSKKEKVNVSDVDPFTLVKSTDTSIGDHVYGKADSKVVIYEYADFQCPGCGGAYPNLKKVKEEYKDRVAFVYRHFPIITSHPNALAASTAAEAAGLQGKFWEMHNALFENQESWSTIDAAKRTDAFAKYADEIGIDVVKFKNDLSDERISQKISRDRAIASKADVTATPTLYINKEKIDGAIINDLIRADGSQMKSKIDTALKSAQ